jgi:Zn-dependent peptidase ImmA (M78 family)
MAFDELAAKKAVGEAEQFIRDRGITALPIDLVQIAKDLDIEIIAKPTSSKGVSGMLLRYGDDYAIAYATHIDNEGFQRFSIAHELGHYLLAGHIDHLLPAGKNIHESRGGFVSGDPYELEADYFAAGLLMPNPLFSQAMWQSGEGLTAIETLAGLCQTSLTATAIRFIDCSYSPVAMVMSTGKRIDYSFMSDALRQIRGLTWIRKGDPLCTVTATYRFNQNHQRITQAERLTETASTQHWFATSRHMELIEEVIGLGKYGKTLTILSRESDPDDDDEDDDLEESWTPRFRR